LLPKAVLNKTPLTFEDLNQDYGFVLYQSTLIGGKTGILKLNELRDYAIVMINGKAVGTLDRRHNQDSIQLNLPPDKVKLDILVENLGRINFGPYLLKNKKGITESVIFDGKPIENWAMYGLPFKDVNNIRYKAKNVTTAPIVKTAIFNLATLADTYLDMRKWGKGVVWVNGHNLGRYWSVGPQQTLYVPVEWLIKGKNQITVLELLKPGQSQLHFVKQPQLNTVQ
jgi:beta-galactosidase